MTSFVRDVRGTLAHRLDPVARRRIPLAASMLSAHVSSAVAALQHRHLFDDVQTYVMFIGHARSGHSLVGSLLNAHPDAVIAHELDVLRYVRWRFRRAQIFQLIVERDAASTTPEFHANRRYDYRVSDQWQGRTRHLKVVGDKKGGASTRKLGEHPELLSRLQRTVRVPVRLVQVVRNPYDNISTIVLRSGRDLDEAIDRYFDRCATVQEMQRQVPEKALLCLRHEDFVADPRGSMSDLCEFVGLEAETSYVARCAAIVRPSPHLSRHEVVWAQEHVERVEQRLAHYPFLDGYSFVG